MKRLFDILCAMAGLVVLSPLLIVLATAILLKEGRPVFFRQERVGQFGKPFRIWKFRTMVPNAETLGASLTAAGDVRITPLGAWLRKTKLDELPQLLNVLLGEMSLVGPRPEVALYVAKYNDSQVRVLELVPGITDPASVRYFNESSLLGETDCPETTYVEQVMPEKIRLNLEYAEKANIVSDMNVIVKTIMRIAA